MAEHADRAAGLAAAVLLVTSYVWGYSARALGRVPLPYLASLRRSQYAEAWNALAYSPEQAAIAACGEPNEDELRRSGAKTAQSLVELAAIGPGDDVLEIGCGIGRVGLPLARRCRHWTGADISTNMLAYAGERLRGLSNVRLVRLENVGLREFEDASFDVVYTTDMFEHLDEIDRWRYVQEAFRVLRPGGRFYMDNIDLESEAGWVSFANGARLYGPVERPPYMPRLSTSAELATYAARARFERVERHHLSPLAIVTAVKHAGENR